MRSITKVAAILAVASIAFVSCKKDKKGPDNNPGNPSTRITRIEEDGLTTGTFEYNADGTLKKATTAISPNSQTAFTFSYDAQKKVSEVVTSSGLRAKYMYENGAIKGSENFQDGNKISENIFTYENGKIKTNTVFTAFPQGGGVITYKPTFRIVFTYLPNGNVDKAESFMVDPETNEQTLEFGYRYKQYDDKVSPTSALSDFTRVLFYQPMHKNNPLVEEFIGSDGSVEETTTHVYTYDATTGLPLTLRSTTTAGGGAPTVTNVKFFY